MRILSIETSCDETAVAILDISGPLDNPEIKVLGNSLMSQIDLHQEYGGVYPNLAKREHQKNLPVLLNKVLQEVGDNRRDSEVVGAPEERVKTDAISSVIADLDLIAVTQGPGLEPALWVGITHALELGERWGKPVVPVNHMEGHIYSVLYRTESGSNPKLELPALALLVSGGHTELVLIKDFGTHEIIGKTRDDAVGEAFDKVARMLGLPYPGGPQISKLAHVERQSNPEPSLEFPRPMMHSHDLDFSFSGLKTSVLYKLKTLEPITQDVQSQVARAFEDAAIEVLVSKTRQALKLHEGEVRSLIVGGGVAANTYLKSKLNELEQEFPTLKLHLPESSLTTDNAIMIGIAAYVRLVSSDDSLATTSIEARGNLLLGS